jgi:hypothetical protein
MSFSSARVHSTITVLNLKRWCVWLSMKIITGSSGHGRVVAWVAPIFYMAWFLKQPNGRFGGFHSALLCAMCVTLLGSVGDGTLRHNSSPRSLNAKTPVNFFCAGGRLDIIPNRNISKPNREEENQKK